MSDLLKRIVAYILIAGVGVAAGLYIGRGQVETTTDTQVSHDKTKTVVVERIVTVTKTVHPDGTTTETTKTDEKQVDSSTSNNDTTTHTETKPVLAQYSLGLGIKETMTWDELNPKVLAQYSDKYYVSAGMRVLGPAWIETTYQPGTKQLSLGLRIEF